MTVTRVRGTAAAIALSLVVAACTSDAGSSGPVGDGDTGQSASTANLTETECPRDVSASIVGSASCSTLTVTENRADGTGEVRLLVTTLAPPEIKDETPVLVLGLDTALNYGGITPLAQRTQSKVIMLDARGVGHSSPSLACEPAAPPVTWRDRTGSAGWQDAISGWVRSCADSLTEQGIDVASYGVEEMAADAVELLEALGIEQANVISYGSGSRVVLEMMRDHSDLLRAVVLDTPELPGIDHRAYAATSAHAALEQVLSWCDTDPDCRRRYPEPTTLLDRALRAVDVEPLSVRIQGPTSSGPATLDAALLVRLARQTTTDAGSVGPWALPTALPQLLTLVLEADRSALAEPMAELLGWQGPLCPGYRPKCSPAHVVAEGTAATALCGDVAADGDTRSVALPGFREAYEQAWWWDLCDSWPVERREPVGAVTSDVPALIFAGGLATLPEGVVRRELAGLANASVVMVPTGGHNVIGSECTLDLRNQWLQDPQPVASDVACLDERVEW